MTKTLFILLLAAGLAAAEDQKCNPPPGSVRKIVQLHYLQPYPMGELAKGLGLCVAVDSHAKLLAVSGPATGVTALEETIKKLDVEQAVKQVELTAFILLGGPETSAAPLPQGLVPVVAELKNLFPYQGYQVLDTILMRTGATGRPTSIEGRLPSLVKPTNLLPAGYSFHAGVREVASGQVYFDQIIFSLYEGDGKGNLRIETSTAVRDGQKVVVGKTSSNNAGQAYFLVLGVKLVD